MDLTPRPASPLSGLGLPARAAEPGAGLRLAEAPLRAMITLRADLSQPDVAAAVQTAFGLPMPGIRKASLRGEAGALWMSPDELLLTAGYGQAAAKIGVLTETLAAVRHLAVDVSDARAVIQISGRGAREALAKGAPVDLHPDAFRPGDFRRTRLGRVACAIAQVPGGAESFEVYCFRSMAEHVWRFLEAAARPGSDPQVFPRNTDGVGLDTL